MTDLTFKLIYFYVLDEDKSTKYSESKITIFLMS